MRSLLGTLFLLLALASPAAAHTRLLRSTPAAGDTLRAVPAELRLVFSERLSLRYTRVQVFGPSGDVIDLAPLALDTLSRGREFFIASPNLAASGTYRVHWRVAAADGHVVEGSFFFTLLLPNSTPSESSGSTTARTEQHDTSAMHTHHVDESALPPVYRQGSALNVLLRFLHFAALLAIIGAAVFRTLVLPAASVDAATTDELRRRTRRFAALALTAFLLLMPLRLLLQSAAIHGPELATERMLVGSYLTEMRWGQAWLAQLLLTTFATIAVFFGFAPLLALAALALAFTPAFQGHAAAVDTLGGLAIVADGLHVLAAGAWLGTLAALAAIALPLLWRTQDPAAVRAAAALVNRFSPIALASVSMLAAAGLVTALFHLQHPAQLLGTAYGRTLVLKLVLVGLVLATGWFNWQRVRPTLGQIDGVAILRRSALLELLAASATLAVTAVLVALPTP